MTDRTINTTCQIVTVTQFGSSLVLFFDTAIMPLPY